MSSVNFETFGRRLTLKIVLFMCFLLFRLYIQKVFIIIWLFMNLLYYQSVLNNILPSLISPSQQVSILSKDPLFLFLLFFSPLTINCITSRDSPYYMYLNANTLILLHEVLIRYFSSQIINYKLD